MKSPNRRHKHKDTQVNAPPAVKSTTARPWKASTTWKQASALVRWLIIGGTGLFIVVSAVFVELQRERLVARAQAWREALAAWD